LLLLPLMAWYDYWPESRVLLLPLFLMLGLVVTFGAGVGLAALNVKYRDVRFIIPFIVQFGLYLSPIGFSASEVPVEWRPLYDLNPLVAVIEGFRWCLLPGSPAPSIQAVASSLVVGGMLLLIGVRYFRRVERSFADVV
jgi:lipopolysaccharide transport system permease protein